MNKEMNMAAIYIGSALLICGLIVSMVVTNMSIEKSVVPFKDFIGPVFDLIGIIILAWTLQEQRKINNKQFEAIQSASDLNNLNILISLMEDIDESYQNFEVSYHLYPDKDGSYPVHNAFGKEAWKEFQIDINSKELSPFIKNEVFYYLDVMKHIIFIGEKIIEIPPQSYSYQVLQIKFKKMGNKFREIVEFMPEYTNGQTGKSLMFEIDELRLVSNKVHDIFLHFGLLQNLPWSSRTFVINDNPYKQTTKK